MNEILSVSGLTKHYGSIQAISDLELQIEHGQVFGILGPNGSGKTTTLSIITGIIHANSGSYQWFGRDPSPESLQKIGSLVEIPYFYPYLSLLQNLKIIATIKNIPEEDIGRVLGLTNLLSRKHSKFSTLSLGMKQRLGISAAMLGNPEVLVLDEPTNGLDPEGFAEVRELILQEARNGKTIILASHILDEVEKVCSHVAVLKQGKVIARGKVHELMAGDDVVRVTTEKPEALKDLLVREGWTKTITKENGDLVITLTDDKSPRDLNAFAFEKGHVLDKIQVSKHSLESQFLELVKNNTH